MIDEPDPLTSATDFTLRQLAHFVAVSEDGTISGAAERLFMSPSAVAASLTELERGLGADLVIRRRAQGVSLTPTGRLVLERARALLADSAELGYLSRGQGVELVGPLVIGCFVTLAPTVIPRLLEEFERRHPRVTVDFVEGPQDQLETSLAAGDLDMAILYDINLARPAALDSIVLYEPRGYALFGEGHPLAERETVALADLAREPLVLFDQAPSASYALSAFALHGLDPHVRHRTHTYELTRSIVARGIGYAILVQRPPNKASYEGLPILEREVDPPLPVVPVILAWPRAMRLSSRATALLELARRQYPATTRT
jgi:DNA-binding transcriptional LysR family regulator